MTRRVCAATRLCDVTGFPSVPQHCIADALMAWDFLCTFHRVLLLQPIDLPDFCAALAYNPPASYGSDDLAMAPPVFLVETHLGLLRLLLQDEVSKEWWFSVIETDAVTADTPEVLALPSIEDAVEDESKNSGAPVIKVDMALLLAQSEDGLRTTSWVKSLEDIGSKKGKTVRETIKAALKLTGNKWVIAYLRKALSLFRSPSGGPSSTRRAVQWLISRVKEARPDLSDATVKIDEVNEQRSKVVEQSMIQMESLPDSAPAVADEDAMSDQEEDESDEESDDDEEEEEEDERVGNGKAQVSDEEQPASSVPQKPAPTLVDLLLPNEKPNEKAVYMNPFTWAQMTGATTRRILHRRKRVLNEIDDNLRASKDEPPLTVPQRREREKQIAARVLGECHGQDGGDPDFVEAAIEHLCSGGQYLELTFAQRLCILRLLIEAAYDSRRIHDVVIGNYNQRASAMKALEQEKRKAKKDAKEKAAADEVAAREKLAAEAREKFLDDKREEIRKLNDVSHELSDEMVESLTDEDILEFDEDIKADYEALPTPESFTKNAVSKMVERMQEEAAFDTDALTVLTLDKVLERERLHLEEMEGQLVGFGGDEALMDESLDRETIKAIESLRKDIEKAKVQAERLPAAREKAVEQLRDGMEDGTIKVLRSAVTAAKKAKLSGPDDETGGIWALDLLRDAALELENAKQNKKLIDAQKDLVAKRNKCFIRTEPVGRDRFGNRFWKLDHEEEGSVWAEAEYSLKQEGEGEYEPPPGYAVVVKDGKSITVGAPDREEDFLHDGGDMDIDACRSLSRMEYHSTGFSSRLVQNHWGCHTSEESLRKVIKSLDGKSGREKDLKSSLKESLEKVDRQENEPEVPATGDEDNPVEASEAVESDTKSDGDEDAFAQAKKEYGQAKDVSIENLDELSSALARKVRVRIKVDGTKDNDIAKYESGTVNAWKTRPEQREIPREAHSDSDDDEMETERQTETVHVPLWRVGTELGNVVWLESLDLLESMSRFEKSQSTQSYFEHDAAFLGYRNTMGRFCGKASEASYASSPVNLAKLMVKKEAELYPKLKIRSYDEFWGGSKSGERAAWTNKMKDYAFDTETVKQGLLTLENAFFQITGEFDDYDLPVQDVPEGKVILEDTAMRELIELESDKNVVGIWNRPASRAVFIEIVSNAATTGLLALALELLSRNTTKYLKKHGLLNTRTQYAVEEDFASSSRRPRRKNAWQSSAADTEDWYE
uniref:DDT domain-containing protein n=1 Tax=Entomoneis paludosa TaxID=265537 RepID=A0A7S2YBB6_9STRA